MWRRTWLLVFGASLGAVGSAAAQSSHTRASLAFARNAGAESCVDQTHLKGLVAARLGREPFDDQAPLRIEGVVSRVNQRFVLDLRTLDGSGSVLGQRHLESESADCAELGEAAALAIALSIDPNAPLTAPAPAAAVGSASEPVVATSPVAIACPPLPPQLVCRKPAPSVVVAEPTMHRVSFSVRAPLALELVPGFAAGVGVSGRVTGERVALTLGASWFREALADDERFSIGLSLVQVGGCLRAWSFPKGMLALCAELQAGSQHAVVRQLSPLEPGDHLFVATAIGPQVWLDLTRQLQLELGVSADIPLWRPEFVLRSTGQRIFESPSVIPLGFLGFGFGAPSGH
ncbi:MAG: hypothetical protein QM756_02610 [Polyangiaceae bacterium]